MSDEIKYEQAINRIEEIIASLENNEIALEDSLALFEEGTRLTKLCYEKISSAKAKIVEIEKE
ncbi:MAG: exodeoxyribonuclease VII small subunit [Eubacterium sp.]